MPPPSEHDPSFSPARRLSIAASVVLSTCATLVLVFLFNYLAQQHAPRLYWGASRDFQLSPHSRAALKTLTNRVVITVFFDRDHPAYPSVRATLREYAAASPLIEVKELDYTRNPSAALDFRRRFPALATGEQPDLVLFEAQGRTKVVQARDLRDYDTQALLRGQSEARPIGFKGELLFTSAINAVMEGAQRRVYFLTGHREHNINSPDVQAGYSFLGSVLREDNIELAPLGLSASTDVPRDCDVLVVAGPQDAFSETELQSIDRYLRRGGRLLVLFRHRAVTGLERLLSDWGLSVADSMVEDRDHSDSGALIVSRFGTHPITSPLADSRVYLFRPRAVEPRSVANILGAPARLETLMRSGTNGVAVTTFAQGDYRYSPDDQRGEIPLAVAVERGALPGVASNLGTTRIVAIGESTFLANRLIQFGANRHVATSSLQWLLDRSHLLGGLPPVPIRTYQVIITPAQQRLLRLLLLGVLPGSALAMAFIVWWRRH